LIIGGYYYTSSVELYNWKTGKQCKLPDFPIPVCCGAAAVMGGTPAYCGGESTGWITQGGCYKFEKTNMTWKPVF
jgi:hypothetical protein